MKGVKVRITELKDYLLITVGSFITAISINVFNGSLQIAPGGISGVATVIYYLSDEKVPVGTAMLILNIPLFLMGIKLIGKKFIIKTLYGTALLSVLIDANAAVYGLLCGKLSCKHRESPVYTGYFAVFDIRRFAYGNGIGPWCSDPGRQPAERILRRE